MATFAKKTSTPSSSSSFNKSSNSGSGFQKKSSGFGGQKQEARKEYERLSLGTGIMNEDGSLSLQVNLIKTAEDAEKDGLTHRFEQFFQELQEGAVKIIAKPFADEKEGRKATHSVYVSYEK